VHIRVVMLRGRRKQNAGPPGPLERQARRHMVNVEHQGAVLDAEIVTVDQPLPSDRLAIRGAHVLASQRPGSSVRILCRVTWPAGIVLSSFNEYAVFQGPFQSLADAQPRWIERSLKQSWAPCVKRRRLLRLRAHALRAEPMHRSTLADKNRLRTNAPGDRGDGCRAIPTGDQAMKVVIIQANGQESRRLASVGRAASEASAVAIARNGGDTIRTVLEEEPEVLIPRPTPRFHSRGPGC
jgi:hypothetical protein